MSIPKSVIETDHKLEASADRSQEQLAQHRWHQTLDPSGPMYSINAYAKAIGHKGHSTVQKYAKGYADWKTCLPGEATLSDCMTRANMAGETLEATEAIAQARGVASKTVQSHHRPQVRSTIARARERSEETGASVSEAIGAIAKEDVALEAAEKAKRVPMPLRFVKMDKLLRQARVDLKTALTEARKGDLSGELGEEITELLTDTVDNIAALLGLLRSAIAGDSGVDWDAEMSALRQS